jgi:hypothetical protein
MGLLYYVKSRCVQYIASKIASCVHKVVVIHMNDKSWYYLLHVFDL